MRHLCAEPAPLPDVVPGLPDYIWRVVERAMRKEPTRRYASMFDFSIAMREARNKAIVAARRHGRPGAAAPLVPVARAAYGSSSPAKTPSMLPAASRQELGPRGTFKMPHVAADSPPEPTPGVQARGQQGAETSEGSLPERGEGGERVVAVRKQATGVRPHATQRRFRLRPWHGALVGACLSLFRRQCEHLDWTASSLRCRGRLSRHRRHRRHGWNRRQRRHGTPV